MSFLVVRLFLALSVFGNCYSELGCWLPGLNKLYMSVDITVFDLLPLEGGGVRGSKQPVMQSTCTLKPVRIFKQGNIGAQYRIPDQLATAVTTPGASRSASTRVFRSYQQVRNDMAASVGISGDLFFGSFAFSASVSYKSMQETITNSEKQILDSRTFEYSHYFLLKDPEQEWLTSGFRKAIAKLKGKTFISDRKAYEKFVKKYGTHYLKSGNYGGMIRQYLETSSSYAWTKSESELKTQASAKYKGLINSVSAKAKYSEAETKVNMDFANATRENSVSYGGEVNFKSPKGIEYWQHTVDKDPVLLKVETAPLYELISDDDKEVKLNVKNAIDEYVMRKYLGEIQRKLIVGSKKYPNSMMDDLQTKLDILTDAEFLDIEEVKKLDASIEYNTVIPTWFRQETEFCFKYAAAEMNTKQCNGRTITDPKLSCATPDHYTEVYHDNTGFSKNTNKGCYLQWSIYSSNYDAWFKKTRICVFAFTPKTKSYGGGCAEVNRFTDEWEDTSSNWDDYNELRWRIEIPEDPPLWIKRSKFCFKWEPKNSRDKYQCHGKYRETCVSPQAPMKGPWTATYYDKSMSGNNEGCLMKWGWFLNK